MKAFTASLLTLGLAAAVGMSTRDAIGDHGQPGLSGQVESVPAAPPTRAPQPAAPSPVSRETRCGTVTPQYGISSCTLPRREVCQVTSAEIAAELHFFALTLADDIDFDLYGTRNFTHLIRDAKFVIRDVISVRRALARHQPVEVVAAEIRSTVASLEHLENSIGRRYRTRAIHFALLDAQAALGDLVTGLRVDPVEKNITSGPALTVPQLRPDDPDTGGLPMLPPVPRSVTPPVPPALRSDPARPSAEPEVLVIPEPLERLTVPDTMKGIRQLSLTDQRLAMKQRTCLVTGDLLGSMGKPIKVNTDGRTVFVCCQGCVDELRSSER